MVSTCRPVSLLQQNQIMIEPWRLPESAKWSTPDLSRVERMKRLVLLEDLLEAVMLKVVRVVQDSGVCHGQGECREQEQRCLDPQIRVEVVREAMVHCSLMLDRPYKRLRQDKMVVVLCGLRRWRPLLPVRLMEMMWDLRLREM